MKVSLYTVNSILYDGNGIPLFHYSYKLVSFRLTTLCTIVLGDVTITNDGATILDQMKVVHPAAKMLVNLSKAQDVEAGDGTTSVVVLAGSMLEAAEKLLKKGIHPSEISESFQKAAAKSVEILTSMAQPVDLADRDKLLQSANTSLNSKVVSQHSSELSPIAVDAVLKVSIINQSAVRLGPFSPLVFIFKGRRCEQRSESQGHQDHQEVGRDRGRHRAGGRVGPLREGLRFGQEGGQGQDRLDPIPSVAAEDRHGQPGRCLGLRGHGQGVEGGKGLHPQDRQRDQKGRMQRFAHPKVHSEVCLYLLSSHLPSIKSMFLCSETPCPTWPSTSSTR